MKKCMYLLFLTINLSIVKSEEYIDPVIDLLLNGDNSGSQSNENDTGDDHVLLSGIWKCGNCTDIDSSKLVYSEENDMDDDMTDDDVDIQISFTLQGMRCVTVAADKAGVVRKLSGACDSDTVTLHVTLTRHFTVKVYN